MIHIFNALSENEAIELFNEIITFSTLSLNTENVEEAEVIEYISNKDPS